MAKSKGFGQVLDFSFLTSDLILKHLLFVLFLGFIATVYIANAHFAERNVRNIQELRRELKEQRWYYMTLQAENMFNSRRSEMARKVQELGLQNTSEEPKKIVVHSGR